MASILSQALVEYMEQVALASGARWDYHNYCYLDFQTSIQMVVEEGDTFSALPGAFSSEDTLCGWVGDNQLTIWPIWLSSELVYMTVGNDLCPPRLRGISFIWVKATSPTYRNALVCWLNYLRRDRDLARVHENAATVYDQVAQALEKGVIRKKIKPKQRANLVTVFQAMASRCRAASTSSQAAKEDRHLLKPFDSTLDADHVINKQSLKDMPDAWVMLAPVIASSNRGFGRAVEKYAVRFPVKKGSIGLDAATAFKLFAPSFPSTASTFEEQIEDFKLRFVPRGPVLQEELEKVADTLRGFVTGTSTSFLR